MCVCVRERERGINLLHVMNHLQATTILFKEFWEIIKKENAGQSPENYMITLIQMPVLSLYYIILILIFGLNFAILFEIMDFQLL